VIDLQSGQRLAMNTPVSEEDALRIDPTAAATLAAAVLEESKGVTPKELLVTIGDSISVQEDNYLKFVAFPVC
jgi:hypothetical protein